MLVCEWTVNVPNKPQTYSLTKALRRNCCLMTLMIIFSGRLLANLWVGKENMCIISLPLGQTAPCSGCHFFSNDDRFALVSCLSLLQRCQLQGEGVSPTHLWKTAENKQTIMTGRLEHERRLKSNNNWRGLVIWTSGEESDISKQTLEGWDWSWQMSKSWPKMIALITTHIQMY